MFTGRNLLRSIPGAAFLGIVSKSKAEPKPQSVPSEYGHYGESMAQAYKLHEDGTYRLVPRLSLKAGDKFIVIGVDGDRLWRVCQFEVGEGEIYKRPAGKGVRVSVTGGATAVLID